VFLFCLLLPLGVHATEPGETQPPVTVVSDDNYPPYLFRDGDGKLQGYLVDAWALWEKKTGRRVRLIATDWVKAQRLMEDGQGDVIDTIFQTAEREKIYDFTPPYADIDVPIYVHGSIGGITNVKALSGFLVGVKAGDACIDRLKEEGLNSFQPFNSYAELVEAAVAEKIKIFCLDEPPANYLLYRSKADRDFYKAFTLYSGQFHRAVRKGDLHMLGLVRQGFDAMTAAELLAMHDKWMGAKTESRFPLRLVVYGLLAALATGGILAGWVLALHHQVRRRTTEFDQQRSRLRTVLHTIPDLIWLKDPNGVYLTCNPPFERLFGAAESEIAGKTDFDFVDSKLARFFRLKDQEAIASGRPTVNEESVTFASDGRQALLETIKTPMLDDNGKLVGVLGIARDITEYKKAEAEIQQLAFYDWLTKLPNRRLLQERLTQAKANSAHSGICGALIFIDIDNFKTLNDTKGHQFGDLLLEDVAKRLSACLRQGDLVARFGGDEFVVIAEGLGDKIEEARHQADVIGEKILLHLAQPYGLETYLHHCAASLGITLFCGADMSNDDLLKQADLAMYQAKAAGKNTKRFFDPHMQKALAADTALENALRLANKDEEFVLYFQPQIARSGELVGAEGLIRWFHPERGLVLPGEFIAVAESSGLILPIGLTVLEMACRQLVAWSCEPATRDLSLAINVSARQFHHPAFVDDVRRTLRSFDGADPSKLKLELTESVLLRDIDDCGVKMMALRELGVHLALDDFGTGYSSLTYLKRLPFSQLKIDRSFVRDVLADPNDAAVARTIILLAKSFGLKVIAEGVEEPEQWRFLLDEGCDEAQGYFFGYPMPCDDFLAFAKSRLR
jgi:diguanylate cyclase (GGDEF)-like protein/PAS domain S-box-containing protein